MKWDKELKALRKMRKPVTTRSKAELDATEERNDATTTKGYSLYTENVCETEEALKTSSQLVSLQQIKSSTMKMSSSFPAIASINNLVKDSTLSEEIYVTTDNLFITKEKPVSFSTINNVRCKTNQDGVGKEYDLGLIEKTKANIEIDVLANQSGQLIGNPSMDVCSSFFRKSPPTTICIDNTPPSQKYGHSRVNSKSSQYLMPNTTKCTFKNHESSPSNKPRNESLYKHLPPRVSDLNLPSKGVVYKEPYYSKPSDLPRYPTVFAGKEFKPSTTGISSLKEFISTIGSAIINKDLLQNFTRLRAWSPATGPPTFKEVKEWVVKHDIRKKELRNSSTQVRCLHENIPILA